LIACFFAVAPQAIVTLAVTSAFDTDTVFAIASFTVSIKPAVKTLVFYAHAAAGTVIVTDTFLASFLQSCILIAVFAFTARGSRYAHAFIAAPFPAVTPQAIVAVAVLRTFNTFIGNTGAETVTICIFIACQTLPARFITKLAGTGNGPRFAQALAQIAIFISVTKPAIVTVAVVFTFNTQTIRLVTRAETVAVRVFIAHQAVADTRYSS